MKSAYEKRREYGINAMLFGKLKKSMVNYTGFCWL